MDYYLDLKTNSEYCSDFFDDDPHNEEDLINAALTHQEFFYRKMKELRAFSSQISNKVDLPTVSAKGGLFGLFDYSVKGNDFNSLSEAIETLIIQQNTVLKKLYNEPYEIYRIFNALDNGYIREFQKNIAGIKRTNERINESLIELEQYSQKLEKQHLELDATQKKTKELLDGQRQIIGVLKNFKNKLENQKHLSEIDIMYASQAEIKNEQSDLSYRLNNQQTELKRIHSALDQLTDSTEHRLIQLNEIVEKQENEQSNLLTRIGNQQIESERINNTLDLLIKSTEQSLIQINEMVDTQKNGQLVLTNRMNNQQSELKNLHNTLNHLIKSTEQRLIQMNEIAENQKNDMDKQSEEIHDKLGVIDIENDRLLKSLFYYRIVSFGSLALTIVLFILILSGVLR
jgi:hypothetical protein